MVDTFFTKDLGTIRNYVIVDVIFPTIKRAISEIVRNGIDMLLYPDANERRRNTPYNQPYRTSYNSSYPNGSTYSYGGTTTSSQQQQSNKPQTKIGNDYEDVTFPTRGEAELVLSRMIDQIHDYGIASVSNFYDLSRIEDDNYTNNFFGWKDLSSAEVLRSRYGDEYYISFPRATTIK